MLYFLYEWFFAPQGVRVVLRLLRYPTFRALGAAATAFLLWLILGPKFIRLLSRAHLTEKTRDYSPFNIPRKRIVPTMGGALIVGATVAAALLWCDIKSRFVPPILGAGLFFAAVGAIDDLRKLRGGSSDHGLPAAAKLAAQFAFGALLAAYLLWPATSPIPDEAIRGSLYVPFVKTGLYLGPAFALLVILFTAFASNCVNITDGMDGLAIVPAMLVAIVLAIFAYLLGSPAAVAFLQYFPAGQGEVAYRSLACMEVTVICGALVGAGAGFLWFNAYPA
ncbi:MAG: phospho-N-acetylmuramoyl-pentapeptide-transferase, partial [Planctomycetes bacterium]|nr:phospho-N-acetylmuramoyl-pentapeptide-transferase [Planctomycetota bacterium]